MNRRKTNTSYQNSSSKSFDAEIEITTTRVTRASARKSRDTPSLGAFNVVDVDDDSVIFLDCTADDLDEKTSKSDKNSNKASSSSLKESTEKITCPISKKINQYTEKKQTRKSSSKGRNNLNVKETVRIDCESPVNHLSSSGFADSDPQVIDGKVLNRIPSSHQVSEDCTTSIDDLSEVKDIPEPPKKTARRGLARKNVSTDTSVVVTHKNASVYSQCVDENFKKNLQRGAILDTVLAQEITPIKTKGLEKQSVFKTDLCKHAQDKKQAESKVLDDLDSSIIIRSPTPPPEDKIVSKKINKKLSKALDTLSQAKDLLDKVTPHRKRKEGKKSLGSDDIEFVYEELKTDMLVKVRYLTNVHRISMKMKETFKELVSKMSQEIHVEEHKISLFLNDQQLKLGDTPLSVGLSVADIIECHCIRYSEDNANSADLINLVIRMSNRSKTSIEVNKRLPIENIIDKFAKMKGLDPSELVFSFDGEELDPKETPFMLDMEEDDCIDCTC